MARYTNWNMTELGKMIRAMQLNKYDAIICVDGKRGIGKSTLALKLAKKINPNFNYRRDIVYSRDDVMKQLSTKKNGIILADEMINVTYNRDFWSADQKTLLKMLNMYRDSQNVLIACVPNFSDMDKQFRTLVKIRIHVVRRGVGVLHKARESAYSTDVWDTASNQKIERQWTERGAKKPRYHRLTTFVGLARFHDLSEKQREIYENIKQEKRAMLEGKEIEEQNIETLDHKRFVNGVYPKLKEGSIDRDVIRNLSFGMGWNFRNVISLLSIKARNEGTTLTEIWKKQKSKTTSNYNSNQNLDQSIQQIV